MSFTEEYYCHEIFTRISLTQEIVEKRTFEACEFSGCSFIDCKFERSVFLNCKFTECVLSATVPLNCRLTEVKFNKCKVIGIDWTRAKEIEDLEFLECQVNYSNFKFLKLPKIKIKKCEAKEADFTEADLSGGDFQKTDFEKSRFFKTNLTRADFRKATSYNIDTQNNILKQTRFSLPEALSLLNSLDIILE